MSFKKLVLEALACALVLGTAMAADAAKVGETCGGFAAVQCDKGLWCDPFPGQCGGVGTCVTYPANGGGCPKLYAPVCACDGRSYDNDCFRQHDKIGKRHDGKC